MGTNGHEVETFDVLNAVTNPLLLARRATHKAVRLTVVAVDAHDHRQSGETNFLKNI